MKSCITVSLVEEARGGPFVLWDGLEKSIAFAGELGYDAVEIFAPGPEVIDADALRSMLDLPTTLVSPPLLRPRRPVLPPRIFAAEFGRRSLHDSKALDASLNCRPDFGPGPIRQQTPSAETSACMPGPR